MYLAKIVVRNYGESFEKISCKRWRSIRMTSEKFLLNLENYEEILEKSEDPSRKSLKE